jgi:acyl-CoA synthetase (AMP-forming)/AMP-acid ligase II
MLDKLATAANLGEALRERARISGSTRWLTLLERDRETAALSFEELYRNGLAWAGTLRDAGVGSGEAVLIVLPTGRVFYESYWGCLLLGATAVPLYPPVREGKAGEYADYLRSIAEDCEGRALVTMDLLAPLLTEAVDPGRCPVLTAADSRTTPPAGPADVAGNELGLLQYTSGSTGRPKGVGLSHGNLLANIRATGQALSLSEEDRAVSWLPLYHDMGLIGLMMGTVYWGVPLTAFSPLDFLRRPTRWLRAISDTRATVSAGPNFAYALVARKAREEEIASFDLSSWRVALCGAEPIHPSTIAGFTRRYAPRGFRPEAFLPAYGLAEGTLAVAFSEPDTAPHILHLDAERLEREGRAVELAEEKGGRGYVSVGRPIPTVEMDVVDSEDRVLPDGVRGEIRVRGPSVMQGYFRKPAATETALRNGWLHTGDLGFRVDGRYYICGRIKDLVIKAGRNYFAEDLEAAASAVPGVRPGGVCVFSVEDRERGTEEVVLVVESAQPPPGLAEAVTRAVRDATGCAPDRVMVMPPRTVPKTTSGKVQRFKARQAFLEGTLGAPKSGRWRLLAELAWAHVRVFFCRGKRPGK